MRWPMPWRSKGAKPPGGPATPSPASAGGDDPTAADAERLCALLTRAKDDKAEYRELLQLLQEATASAPDNSSLIESLLKEQESLSRRMGRLEEKVKALVHEVDSRLEVMSAKVEDLDDIRMYIYWPQGPKKVRAVMNQHLDMAGIGAEEILCNQDVRAQMQESRARLEVDRIEGVEAQLRELSEQVHALQQRAFCQEDKALHSLESDLDHLRNMCQGYNRSVERLEPAEKLAASCDGWNPGRRAPNTLISESTGLSGESAVSAASRLGTPT